MNRIIIIGNGFDLAHDLKTSYKDFMDAYWKTFSENVFNTYFQKIKSSFGVTHSVNYYRDDFASIETKNESAEFIKDFSYEYGDTSFGNLCRLIIEYNNSIPKEAIFLNFKNTFLGHISSHCSLTNWVDIENEYYDALKVLCLEENAQERSKKVKTLNREFNAVKKLLEKYLNEISQSPVTQHVAVREAMSSPIELNDVAIRKQEPYLDSIIEKLQRSINTWGFFEEIEADLSYSLCSDVEANRIHLKKKLENDNFKRDNCKPSQTVLLNFNYTNTAEKLYINEESNYEVINIHGQLNHQANPIIFGYGDELDNDYRKIEGLQDNDFLENIKSIHYHKTRNYRRLLELIESELYQVFVMGHSCGNSDRTLLNTLFEHDNCAAIKVYYWQQENYSDNYSDLIRNISRNFNDKPKMRDIVVNWEYCSPLVPMTKDLNSQ